MHGLKCMGCRPQSWDCQPGVGEANMEDTGERLEELRAEGPHTLARILDRFTLSRCK